MAMDATPQNIPVPRVPTTLLDMVRGFARPIVVLSLIAGALFVWTGNAETVHDRPLVQRLDTSPRYAPTLQWSQPDVQFEGLYREGR